MTRGSTADGINIFLQMHEKNLIRKEIIYFAFADLEKALDWVSCSPI